MPIKISSKNVPTLIRSAAATKKEVSYTDETLPGFVLRVFPSGRASWATKVRVDGKYISTAIGSVELHSYADAKEQARELIRISQKGESPKALRKRERVAADKKARKGQGFTLRRVLSEYLAVRDLKPRSKETMRQTFAIHFDDWMERPLKTVTRQEVEERIGKVMKDAAERSKTRVAEGNKPGQAQAHKALRYLRAVFRFAMILEDDDGDSPVTYDPTLVVTRKKLLKPLKRKSSYLGSTHRQALVTEALKRPDGALRALSDEVFDALMMLYYTGMRLKECISLRWASVDLDNRVVKQADTKTSNLLLVPFTTEVQKIIDRRPKGTTYVFEGYDKAPVNPAEVYEAFRTLEKLLGAHYSPHDFRRTFATVADEIGLPHETIKRLLNHVTSDVTSGYIIKSISRMREDAQAVVSGLGRVAQARGDSTAT